nr:uncharacterized protein LOC128701185 [Cherax quadricarinatus]
MPSRGSYPASTHMIVKAQILSCLVVVVLHFSHQATVPTTVYQLLSSSLLEGAVTSKSTISEGLCALNCLMNSQCQAFNWAINTSINNCQMTQYKFNITITANPDYNIYMLMTVPVPVEQNMPGLWGQWTAELTCDTGSFIYGYTLWYAPYAGVNLAVDDCGVSGIKLLCMTQQGMQTTSILFNQNYILNAQQALLSETSVYQGSYHQLGECTVTTHIPTCRSVRHCTKTWVSTGCRAVGVKVQRPAATTPLCKDIRARFHLTTGSEDRDALNQVLFRCQDSTQLSSYTSNDTGTWGVWTSCVPGSVMCGARVMYQPVSALSDNTCFNEILMLCCFL